jgi:cell division protein FtsQ
MRLYLQFTGELNAGPEKISKKLSEVDLSDPEDIKALIPDSGADVLVHFGGEDFLPRYQRYVQNLPDWKTKYPKLASVDMRYQHEVVLEMAPGATVPVAGGDANAAAPGTKVVAGPVAAKKVVAKKAGAKVVVKPKAVVKKAVAKKPVAGHLQNSFSVRSKAGPR